MRAMLLGLCLLGAACSHSSKTAQARDPLRAQTEAQPLAPNQQRALQLDKHAPPEAGERTP